MKQQFLLLGLAALSLASCQQFKKGEGGMLYKIHKDVSGPTLKEGDFISIRAVQKNEKDSVMYSSYELDQPTFIPMQKSTFKGDLYSALEMLSEGDSATFKLPVDSLVKRGMQAPPGKDKFLVYTFKIDKVIQKGKQTDQQFNSTIEAYIGKERERAKAAEAGKLDKYIKDEDLKPETTPSGLKYVIDQKGSGPVAAAGDTVQANYTLTLVSGKIIDTTDPAKAKESVTNSPMRTYQPAKFAIGAGGAIAGFEEGLKMLPKGSKAKLLIPSKLGYGEQGQAPIGPFTPLVFEVEVINVIKGSAVPPPPPAPVAPAPSN